MHAVCLLINYFNEEAPKSSGTKTTTIHDDHKNVPEYSTEYTDAHALRKNRGGEVISQPIPPPANPNANAYTGKITLSNGSTLHF